MERERADHAAKRRATGCSGWVLAALLLGMAVPGANAGLDVEIIAAPNFVVDSNVESPSSYGPRSAYLEARFRNTGSTTLSNVYAYIGDYIDGANDTPGLYPTNQHPMYPTIVGPLTNGTFALTHEGGSAGRADATRYVGTLAPGESVVEYWLVSYPTKDIAGKAVWGPSIKPDDDLQLRYDVWASGVDGGTTQTVVSTRTVTMRNEISAMANKIFPNTANKVPPEYQALLGQYAPAWTNIASDGSAGTLIQTEGIWYDLGNVGQGFDADGDLVPDRDLWMQPVGDPSLFDAGAFRLVRTYVLIVVKLKTGGDLVFTAEDQLYFKDIPENNGAVGYVAYQFMAMGGAGSSTLTPYQEVASGADNEKFNGDYGATIGGALTSPSPGASFAKDVSKTLVGPGESLQYTLTFTNTGVVAMGNPSLNLPVAVQDRIPTGTAYVAGSATSSNTPPAGVAGYQVYYSTNNALTWSQTEPVPASAVTHLQWWLTDPFATGSYGTVRFSVTVTNPYTGSPMIVNTGGLSIGSSAPFLTDTADSRLTGTNRLGDTVFRDDGAGVLFGNGVQNTNEVGLSNITVNLYYDGNSNGTYDATDLYLGYTVTATNGTYGFTNLPAGRFLAVVDINDPDLPAGWTLTTPAAYSALLGPGGTNAFLAADYGFAPALTLNKSLQSGSPLYEGRTVTYALDVRNNLPGSGTGSPTNLVYTTYARAVKSYDTGWGVSSSNVVHSGEPDGSYATNFFDGMSQDNLAIRDFTANLIPSSTNVSVKVVVPIRVNWFAGDKEDFWFILANGAGTTVTQSPSYYLTNQVNGTLTWDITTATNNWSFLSDTNTSLTVVARKAGGTAGEYLLIDAIGLQITSTQQVGSGTASTTMKPVPLVDTYDTNQLQFVSASVTPTSVSSAGRTGTLYWADVGPLYPGGTNRITVTFNVLQPAGNLAGVITNRAAVTNAWYLNGLRANGGTSEVAVTVRPTGRIGDFIWRDLDGDGVQDGGTETGIAGVRVVLTPPANADAGSGMGVPVTNVTDAAGYYVFTGIYGTNSGSYTVAVQTNTLPGTGPKNTYDFDQGTNAPNSAATFAFNPASTTGGDVELRIDFGYQVQTRIEGTIWNDVNRNGTNYAENGEGWLTNVTVYLYASTNLTTAIATNTSNVNGYFSFTGGYTGSYVVVVATNTGAMTNGTWTQTYDSDVATSGLSNRVAVTVVGGGSAWADFSYCNVGTFVIGDQLFYDWNSNMVFEANEEGIPFITVSLYEDANSNGVVDAGVDALVAVAQTDTSGTYLFTNLPPGSYQVIVDQADPQFPPLYLTSCDPYGAKDGRSVVTLTTGSNTSQDFGYLPYGTLSIGDTVWLDLNADGYQYGAGERGLSNITVSLYVDMNGDGVYVLRSTAVTDGTGYYQFASLPGGPYKVVVDSADPDLPKDAFGYPVVPTTATNIFVTLTSSPVTNADFGFAMLGAVGDTIFRDLNANGNQDGNETGITNVTVWLYQDVNSNGVVDAGDTNVATTVTSTNGLYLFSGLPAGRYVVLVNSNSGELAGSILTADPNNDGLPYGDPLATNYDHAVGFVLGPGSSFMGADFGYRPPGVIGDTVWFDMNTNGVRDAGEYGIPYVTVGLYSNGVLIATNDTDASGTYGFGNLLSGTYSVRVLTNDADFPAGVTNVCAADLTTDSEASAIVISNGVVMSVGGNAWTNGNMAIDFGYRYAGDNTLSGTIGMDAMPYDGVMGTGTSGVGSNEAPFASLTVYAYLWRDLNSNGVMEASERILIGSTTTTTNGDYQFSGLPSAIGTVTNRYVIATAPPLGVDAVLTTTNGVTPALSVVNATNTQGETTGAYQILAIASTITDVDFAFAPVGVFDYGDLPSSYGTLLTDPTAGARHVVRPTPDLYLGDSVDTEGNGQPTPAANGDDANGVPDDEDGIAALGLWQTGSSGGVVRVTVGAGSGWLCGYMDFNHDGDFADSNEMLVSRAVTAGTYTVAFSLPAGAILTTNVTWLYGRFRLFPSEPLIPEAAYAGLGSNGEVEDYRFDFSTIGDLVWIDLNHNGVRDGGELPATNVTVYVDLNANGVREAGEPFAVTDTNGLYGIGGLTGGTYTVRVATNTLPAGLTIPTFDIYGPADGVAVVSVGTGVLMTNVDFGYAEYFTLARLVGFRGFSREGTAVIAWDTAEEIDTAGYFLERMTGDGVFMRINADLIPAQLFAGDLATYEQADAGARAGGAYVYRLIEVEIGGAQRYLGPYLVTIDGEVLSLDEWSRSVFSPDEAADPAISGGAADPDGDGMSNLAEFMAGTRPTDAASALRIEGLSETDGGFTISWISASNRFYRVERATELPGGAFEPLTQGVRALPPVNEWTDPAGPSMRRGIYRIRVE